MSEHKDISGNTTFICRCWSFPVFIQSHLKKLQLLKFKSALKPWSSLEESGRRLKWHWESNVVSVSSHILSLIWTVSVFWPPGAERICELNCKRRREKIPRDQKTSAHKLFPGGTRHSDEPFNLHSQCYLSLTALCRPRSTSQAVRVSCGVWVELQIMFQFQFDLDFNELITHGCLWSKKRP